MPINICFCLDENFNKHLLTTLCSIDKNSKNKINCYILGRNVKIKKKYNNINIIYIEIEKKYNNIKNLLSYTTISSLDRFLIPSIINLDKVIYLDVDLVVNDDLIELYELPTPDTGIAARRSIHKDFLNNFSIIKSWVVKEEQKILFKDLEDLGSNLNCKCFNSGVMVLDLNKLRKNNFEKFVFSLTDKYGIPDQITLNAFASGNYFELNSTWNCFANQEKILEHKIIHWAGPDKPWHEHCASKFYWEKYKEIKVL